MKNLFIALILIAGTGTAAAQTQTYKIEVTDNTQIQMMSAQWLAMEKEKRQAQADANYKTMQENYHNINNHLTALAAQTKDEAVLNKIFDAYKLNEKLMNTRNPKKYSKYFYTLSSNIRIIEAVVR